MAATLVSLAASSSCELFGKGGDFASCADATEASTTERTAVNRARGKLLIAPLGLWMYSAGKFYHQARENQLLGLVGDLVDDLAGHWKTDAAARVVDPAPGDRQLAAAGAGLRVQLLDRLQAAV